MEDNLTMEEFVALEVTYDPSLDGDDDKIYFPKKVALAQELIEKYYVPTLPKIDSKSPPINEASDMTDLQKELLKVYAFQPTGQQMAVLKAFLAELFAENLALQTVEKAENALEPVEF